MKTKSILWALLFLPTIYLSAQVEDFALKDYKFTDLRRMTLSTRFDLGNRFVKFKTDGLSNPSEDKSSGFGLDAEATFTYFDNNRTWQRMLAVSSNNEFSNAKLTLLTDETFKRRNQFYDLRIFSENRRYFPNNFFLEANFTLGGRFNANYKEGATVVSDETTWEENESLQIGVGFGRLEFVDAAQNAQYIFRDLKKAGTLARALTADDVKQLADHISVVRNERFFDSRIKRIFQLTQIDSLLQDLGVLEETTALTMALLYDNFIYANLFERYSGSRFSIGLSNSVNLRQYKQEVITFLNSESKRGFFEYGGYIDYSLRIPVNLYWQHSLNTRFTVNYGESKDYLNPVNTGIDDFEGAFNVGYSVGYYPDTRTALTAGANFRAMYVDELEVGLVEENEVQYTAGIFSNLYYYVSPRFRIFGNYRFGNINGYSAINTAFSIVSVRDELKFGSSFYAGFNFAIF